MTSFVDFTILSTIYNTFKSFPFQRALHLCEPPALPALFATDATPESLAISAHEQGGRFAIFSDEGGLLETLGGPYNHGHANIDILLKGIDGGAVRIRRKNHDINLYPYLIIILYCTTCNYSIHGQVKRADHVHVATGDKNNLTIESDTMNRALQIATALTEHAIAAYGLPVFMKVLKMLRRLPND